MDKFYKTSEVQKMFSCSRDYVSKLARARKWRFEVYQDNGRFYKRYLVDDVQTELNRRKDKRVKQV